jgi:hypothetical protein
MDRLTTLNNPDMKTETNTSRAKAPYLAPSGQEVPLSIETSILSGLEGEPIDWNEEIEL